MRNVDFRGCLCYKEGLHRALKEHPGERHGRPPEPRGAGAVSTANDEPKAESWKEEDWEDGRHEREAISEGFECHTSADCR